VKSYKKELWFNTKGRRELVKEKFAPESVVDTIESVYRKLLEKN